MSSSISEDFAAGGGRDAVSKAELHVMLIRLMSQAEQREAVLRHYPNAGLPTVRNPPSRAASFQAPQALTDGGVALQVLLVNFTDEYARVVQGALVRSASDPDAVELRVSVCEHVRYLDGAGAPDPDAWMRLLAWTFSRHVGPVDGEGAGELAVAKTRGAVEAGPDADGEEAMRQASKSTAASEGKRGDGALASSESSSSSSSSEEEEEEGKGARGPE